MTKIIFKAVFHYDRTLAELAGYTLGENASEEVDIFVREIQEIWDEYNDVFFSYFESMGITMPVIWNVYPIHSNGKVTSFAEPTTLIMKDDKEEVIATLVHELCHVFCGMESNEAVLSPVWQQVSEAYKKEDLGTREHIFVNVLARAGLRHIIGPEKAETLLKMEKKYEGLERAWQIIDSSKSVRYDSPLEFLREISEKGALY